MLLIASDYRRSPTIKCTLSSEHEISIDLNLLVKSFVRSEALAMNTSICVVLAILIVGIAASPARKVRLKSFIPRVNQVQPLITAEDENLEDILSFI